MKIWRSKIL